MNKQQLAAKIWASANQMRSKIEANEYKDYILGFMFYKYLSDQEIAFLKTQDWTDADFVELVEDDAETVAYCQNQLGYFISYDNLFSTWLEKGKDFNVSDVRDALSAFNRLIDDSHQKVFAKIFDTLQTGLSKLGDSSGAQTKAISGLIQLIKDIPMDGSQDYDVLGFIYEYLISNFAANAGKKAGEFYTPHEVSVLMAEIVAHHLQGREKIEIYDPTSGSGSLLINIGRAAAKYMTDKDNIKYYAQELKENTYNLTRMNLVMRGILPDNIVPRCGDTLENDWPYFEENDRERTYNALFVDAVVSNPPYSQQWDPTNKETDPRYARFGLAPKGKADYAFLLHDLYHVKPDGIMTIVLPHGVLFRGGEEESIRKNLVEQNHIDAIIGLPANIFFGTGIPTIIMVLKQKRSNTDILMIDASKGFAKEGKNNKLRACDIKKIADTVIHRDSIPKFSRVVTRDEVRANGYNLNIPRYVDSSEQSEHWDIYASMFGGVPNREIDELAAYWTAFPSLRQQLFQENGTPYATLASEQVKEIVTDNMDVQAFIQQYHNAFADFPAYLKKELLDNMMQVHLATEVGAISEDIFTRLAAVPLLDFYQAYQMLDDAWTTIATDLEMVQTEGFDAVRKVDPNLVLKKKDGKEIEVQEGWLGHIIPFELVWQQLLQEKYAALKAKEERLSAIPADYEELIESMTEEEKDSDVLNDAGDAFVAKEVTKKAKELRATAQTEEETAFLEKLHQVEELMKEEKALKTQIKADTNALQTKTIETIETLPDATALQLLQEKWITPLCTSLAEMPRLLLDDFIKQIQALADKYDSTYLDITTQITEAEQALAAMIDDLEGNEFDKKGLAEFQALLLGE